jgi:hypothetical protein
MAASGAVSAQYGAPCATCGAAPYEPCRTRQTRRVTDTHDARLRTVPITTTRETSAPAPSP